MDKPPSGWAYLNRGNRLIPAMSGRGIVKQTPAEIRAILVPEWAYYTAQALNALIMAPGEPARVLDALLAREDLRNLVVSTWLLSNRDLPLELAAIFNVRDLLVGKLGVRLAGGFWSPAFGSSHPHPVAPTPGSAPGSG